MSSAAILLGIGHPPGDATGRTILDVHLHPDCPDGPLSLGERAGRGPDIGTQFTLQQAAEREAAHLQACGCAWLLDLATKERQRGLPFSPKEILWHRPESRVAPLQQPAPPEPPPRVRAAQPAGEVMEKIRTTLAAADFEALEGLRDVLTDESAARIAAEWHDGLPWKVKDAYAALLQDRTMDCVMPVFRDALQSPAAETRAYALCVLTGDFEQFTALLTDSWVDAAKVDAAIVKAGLL